MENIPFLSRDPEVPLKPDFNYRFDMPDVEVDRQARERPHGWFRPRPDGLKARCGGTARSCGVCRREGELIMAGALYPSDKA